MYFNKKGEKEMYDRPQQAAPLNAGVVAAICGGVLLVFSLIILFAGFRAMPVEAGHEGVILRKPRLLALFYDGGVLDDPVPAGTTWRARTTEVIPVDMRPQQFQIRAEDFMSNDGVPLDFEATIRLRVLDSVLLIRGFGVDWFDNNLRAQFFNLLRQAVRGFGMNETAIETTAIDAIDDMVSAGMISYVVSVGIPIELVDINVGRANPPDAIKNQRIATANEQQRKITEVERELAENQRAASERAAAIADNAYRTTLGLTPEQFLTIESLDVLRQQIEMQAEVCKSASCTFVVTGADMTPPTVLPVR